MRQAQCEPGFIVTFMKRRTVIILILLIFASSPALTDASVMPGPGQKEKEKPTAKVTPKVAPKAAVKLEEDDEPQAAQTPAPDQPNQVSVKLERGGKVVVVNRVGETRITGWDSDMIEARAEGDEGPEAVQVRVTGEGARSRVVLSVPANNSRRHSSEINLEIKLPRYADLESIESLRGDIGITGLDGTVTVSTRQGALTIKNVGPLKATTYNGDVTVGGVKGDAAIRSLNGDLTVDNVTGSVNVAATNGNIMAHGTGGNIQVNSASGDIDLHCVKGNATVNTASGDVSFKGAMRVGGSYKLKSISGAVEMAVQPDPPGFTATLITYSGEIETDFPLSVNAPLTGPINRRIVGVYKDGQAQITLDSFSGTVSIVKAMGAQTGCK